MSSYTLSFDDNWYCCVCLDNKPSYPSPNSSSSTRCEDSGCSHSRCRDCGRYGRRGGGGRFTAEQYSWLKSISPVDAPTTPEKPQVGTEMPESRIEPMDLEDEVESTRGDGELHFQKRLSNCSESFSAAEQREALSSSYNTRGVTEVPTVATTVSKAAKVVGINHSTADDNENESVASSIDQFYSGFVTVLGNNLAQDLQDVDLARFEDMLATQLEEFALRFGNEHASANHLRMMSIVYRHSRRIASQICHGTHEEATEDSISVSNGSSSGDSNGISAAKLDADMAAYFEKMQGSAGTICDETTNTGVDTANDDGNEQELTAGLKKLLDSEAYRWLLSVVQRTSRLNGIKPSHMSSHREIVKEQLRAIAGRRGPTKKSHRLVTSKRQPPLYTVNFELPWDPLTFLREECEGENPADAVGQVITLTGDGCSVQAQTCRGYVEQVWPTTGSSFMDLVEDLVTRAGQSCKCKEQVFYCKHSPVVNYIKGVLSDRTEVLARLHDKTCVIEALGTQSGLGDVTEQLLWISTTLRMPSGASTGMKLCAANLVPMETFDYESTAMDQKYPQRWLGKVNFRVTYTTNSVPEGHWPAEGGCWVELFPSCSVTIGYPIPSRKPPKRRGLELPLDIMVSLIGADQVTSFGQDLIIKGYSDLFYATEHNEGCIMWHLICNKRDPVVGLSRISFADRRIPQAADQTPSLLRPEDVLGMRHIVGWTTMVRSNAGAPDAGYGSIISSNLGPPPQGWALDRVQVTAGQYVTIAGGFVRCKKQKPIVTKEDNYILRLRDIGRNTFLLCDVDTHKVWMVNGIGILLHLVRSHLVDAESDEIYQTALAVKANDLKAEGEGSGSKAAFETLRCDTNRALRLHHQKDEASQAASTERIIENDYCLEDLVKSLLHILEQIVDYQSDFRSEDASVGYRVKKAPWERLEGYDFMDVATLRRRIPPRAMMLREDGKEWVQLTRALEAPTLFGKHFGEMLEPSTTDQSSWACGVCHWNDTMPPGRDLLAAQVEDLLIAGSKDPDNCRLRFTNGLYLDMSPILFEPCTTRCQDNGRIQKVQRASEEARSSFSVLEKALRHMKLIDREAKHGTVEIQSSSPTRIPLRGAILLGMPKEPSEPYSQTNGQHLSRTDDHSVQPLSCIDDPEGAAYSSQNKDATTSNSDSGTSRAQTESAPPTHSSSLQLLSNSVGSLCTPGSSVSATLQPSQDDFHRRKRARQRAEERKFHCQA